MSKSVSQSETHSYTQEMIQVASESVHQSVRITGVKSVSQSDKHTVKQAGGETGGQGGSQSLSLCVNQSISEKVNTTSDR